MATDSSSVGVQISVSVIVGSVIGFLAVGILIGVFLGAGLMKLSQNYKTKEISHQN